MQGGVPLSSPLDGFARRKFMKHYLPEGMHLHSMKNQLYLASRAGLQAAMETNQTLEARVIRCDAEHNLWVDLGGIPGKIPREETALGIAEGTTREIAILSRVGRSVSFQIEAILGFENPVAVLSRRKAQQSALSYFMKALTPGVVIPAVVTHTEPFGVFVDIGNGIISMIRIEQISVSRISHPKERFQPGDHIYTVVTGVDRTNGRIFLSHRELLGTWSENAAQFSQGETVSGIVQGVREYGSFIELTPNLSGLAEPSLHLSDGDHVSVYIKSISYDQYKIKLLVIDHVPPFDRRRPLQYFITEGTVPHWIYRPALGSRPAIETIFQESNEAPATPPSL
jgi:small subunit ribosomal protein S1